VTVFVEFVSERDKSGFTISVQMLTGIPILPVLPKQLLTVCTKFSGFDLIMVTLVTLRRALWYPHME